ncbi:MAG TPA: zinc ribbon domain-containing protein [Kiritimatiellia bacterium]|nr:zinc ribbon domain-containing protein [Kiritimatiellia bacterium]
MPIYVYETIPAEGETPRRFEFRQGMTEAPLRVDPESGLPVRRVITGGLEIPRAPAAIRAKPAAPAHGPSCACCR